MGTHLRQGWPMSMKRDDILCNFWVKRNELSIVEDCLFWNHRIIIPVSSQNHVLTLLHRSHLGIVKMKGVARAYFWWSSLNNDLEKMVQSCTDCAINRQSPPKS